MKTDPSNRRTQSQFQVDQIPQTNNMEATISAVQGQQTVTAGPNGSITIGSLQGISAVGGQGNKYNN